MKVLHVIPSVSPFRGGPSQAIRSIVQGLLELGVEVDVATTDDGGFGRRAVRPRRPVFESGVCYRYFSRQLRLYTFSLPLRQWLAKNTSAYDIIHIHSLFSFPAVAAASIARSRHVPYIIRPLGTLNPWGIRNRRRWLKRISCSMLEYRILQHAAWIHYSTEQERTQAEWIAAGLPYRVIPNSTAIPALCAGTGATRRNVLFLSRLHPVKGLDLLLPAFARVRASVPEARLTIAGAGEPGFVRSQQALAARFGLDGAIEWSGFLEGEAKERAFLHADLFVLPSYSENFGLAAVEAMAHGIPVLISDCVGVQRQVSEAGAGMVTPCDADALAEAMQRLLENPALLRRMAENARNLVKSRYSQKTIATMLASEYAQLARRDRSGAR